MMTDTVVIPPRLPLLHSIHSTHEHPARSIREARSRSHSGNECTNTYARYLCSAPPCTNRGTDWLRTLDAAGHGRLGWMCVCVCVWMPCAPILSPPEGSSIRRGEDGTHTPPHGPSSSSRCGCGFGGRRRGAGWSARNTGGRRCGHGRTLQVPWLAFMRSIITHTRTVEVDGWPAPPKVWFPDPKYQSSRPRPNEVGQTPPPRSGLYRHSIWPRA